MTRQVDPLDTDEATNRVEIALRIGLQIVINTGEDAIRPEHLAPCAQCAGSSGAPSAGCEGLDVGPRPDITQRQPVTRVEALDRIANRTDDLAIREVQLDALAHLGRSEIARAYFTGWQGRIGLAEVAFVPLDP